MTTSQPAFSYTHTVETAVPAAAIWALYKDVSTWPLWDEQAVAVTRDGPFAAGTTGTMTFAGQDPLAYRLARCCPGASSPTRPRSATWWSGLAPAEAAAGPRCRSPTPPEVDGPAGGAQVGPMITADFPRTMAP